MEAWPGPGTPRRTSIDVRSKLAEPARPPTCGPGALKGDPKDSPAIDFNGTHHGDELATPEAMLALADHLITHPDEPEVAKLLEKYAIYLQPVVNPDGLAAQKRKNAEGADLNRAYPYPREWFRFETAPEAELVKDLVDEISPKGAVAFHSGARSVLWPWGYKEETPGDANLELASRVAAEAMGPNFEALQSIQDYKAFGDFADYAYWRHGTIALTFEISRKLPVGDGGAWWARWSIVGACLRRRPAPPFSRRS
jgi:predicted deacylase